MNSKFRSGQCVVVCSVGEGKNIGIRFCSGRILKILFDSDRRAIYTVHLDDMQATPTSIQYCREEEIYAL
jgi:hypothetical protein